MAISLLSTLIFAMQAAPPAQPPGSRQVTVANSREIHLTGPLGDCLTRDGRRIDMDRVMFLDSRPVVFDAPGGPFRARVEEQTLFIETVGENSDRGSYYNRIDYQVGEDGGGALDLQIQLAFVEGRLAVFWRETYRNRIYDQGLYGLAGQGVEFICKGRGGIRVEH